MYALKYKNANQRDYRYVMIFSEHLGQTNQSIMKFNSKYAAEDYAKRAGMEEFLIEEVM